MNYRMREFKYLAIKIVRKLKFKSHANCIIKTIKKNIYTDI